MLDIRRREFIMLLGGTAVATRMRNYVEYHIRTVGTHHRGAASGSYEGLQMIQIITINF